MSMEVKLPALSGNNDRQTIQLIDRRTERPGNQFTSNNEREFYRIIGTVNRLLLIIETRQKKVT